MNGDNTMVTCSFTMDRAVYNAYKSVVSGNGENVKGNIVKYMKSVIDYKTPNPETIIAMQEVDAMLKDGTGERYTTVDSLFEELNR